MACVGKIRRDHGESEMEEGEIVDELDDLSDISSEEEFLMRQRLEVLENYNNVLERTKAKRSSIGPGAKPKREIVCLLSEISANKLNDHHHVGYEHNIKIQRHIKPHKPKRKKDPEQNIKETYARRKKDYKKKNVRTKKRVGSKVDDSSDESEDEYRNKRKKLAEAVIVPKHKSDKSSLSARLFKMMHGTDLHEELSEQKEVSNVILNDELSPISSTNTNDIPLVDEPDGAKIQSKISTEPIELSTDDDIKTINDEIPEKVTDQTVETKDGEIRLEKDSDDDLELLRQHALESKIPKPKASEPEKTDKLLSEDEDSDTTELRLICLKSALLKKAIEMKQKQKLQKRLSTSNLEDDLFNDQMFPTKEDLDNNTDIESVDMDMGSDSEERLKDCNVENTTDNTGLNVLQDSANDLINCAIKLNVTSKDDELDEDEDLLRAKLLTSLSKNLTNLVTPEILEKVDEKIEEVTNIDNSVQQNTATTNLEEKPRFIIQVNESDSEGEHEATKNLTKMHIKLSEQIDFQQKLDLFLKSARNQVEKKDMLPDVVQKSPVPKKPEKFIAKTVKHLPKSEQIEYKNLVRRMAELEKLKQSRQAMMYQTNQPIKDTLKPRNVTMDTLSEINNNLEEQIAKSRKLIAEESAKMLKLKEEATKLSQKYKIAATELRNITTAIALNKKQQRTIQNSLSKIRLQHQSLLKNSTTSLHSKVNGRAPYMNNLNKVPSKLQKENNPKDEYNNPQIQKAVKVSVVNDFVAEVVTPTRLSVEVDIANNKKVVKIPQDTANDRIVEMNEETVSNDQNMDVQLPQDNTHLNDVEKETETNADDNAELVAVCDHGNKRYYISVDDYKSPLDALGSTNWKGDPNAILCPFEVSGQCKDPDCKYVHASSSLQ